MQAIEFTTQTGRSIKITDTDQDFYGVHLFANGARLTQITSGMVGSDGMIDCGNHRIGGKVVHIYIPAPADQVDALRAMCANYDAACAAAAAQDRAHDRHVARVNKAMEG